MLGPIEIAVIAFPGSHFTGDIVPALAQLVDTDTISIVDALLVRKEATGEASYTEIDELGLNDDASRLAGVIDRIEGLLSDDDVTELAASLEPGSSAAIMVFEHTWVKPLRDAIGAAGGTLLESIRIPGAVVDEVLSTMRASDTDTN